MRRLRGERGVVLAELLTATALMLIVSFAMLVVLDRFGTVGTRGDERNESQDAARRAVDALVRQLRGIAGREGVTALERSEPYDLVALAHVRPGVERGDNAAGLMRVRLCLDEGGRLLRQAQTWTGASTPDMPGAASCGASAWGPARVLGEGVVNRRDGREVALFRYDDATVTIEAVVDASPGRGASETRLASGVSLRNRNSRPRAVFTATPAGDGHLILNGSESDDADGDALEYEWFDEGVAIGTGVLLDYAPPGGGMRSISLRVTDPAGASDETPAALVEAL